MNCRKKQPQKNAMDNYKIDQVRTSRIKVDYNKSAEGYGILNLKAIDRDFDLFVLNYEGDTIYKSKRQASYVILPRAFLRTGGASRDMVERLKGPSQALYTLLRAYL